MRDSKLSISYWKKIIYIDEFLKLQVFNNRLKIFKIFSDNYSFSDDSSLLDVGTTPSIEKYNNVILKNLKSLKKITCISNQDCRNLEDLYNNIITFTGDAKDMKFQDNNFDVVHCSATLEHVGSFENQIKVVSEINRLAKHYAFISTPNRYYPIELHTKIPFVHFLPKKLFRFILSLFGEKFFSKEVNLNLLSIDDLKLICEKIKIKNYKIIRHKFLFFTSNLILIIKKE